MQRGGEQAGTTFTVTDSLTVTTALLAAVTVMGLIPSTVGVPERVPVVLSEIPAGRVPAVTVTEATLVTVKVNW